MGKYRVKKSQVVAMMIFLVEIIGTLVLAQINVSENVLKKIGYVIKTKTIWGVRQAKEWLAYICSHIGTVPRRICDAVPYCYLSEREVAVQ